MKVPRSLFSMLRPSITVLLFMGLVLFIGWAAYFEIDQGVRAQGQVIASSRTQVIQAADGGVISELRVVEGQGVEAGEVLAVLEKSRAEAGFDESRAREAALKIALLRARAEQQMQVPDFGDAFAAYPNFLNAQERLYLQRKRGLDQELESLWQMSVLALEELRMNEALLESGDVSRLEVMRAKRQVGDLDARMSSIRNKYRQDAGIEVVKLEEDLATINAKLTERKSVLDHTTLVAPVAGVIKYLRVTTIGGVLRGGDELMQIAPTENALVIEAKVSPIDVGMLVPDLPVAVKADAFDYSIYGMMNGNLTYISPDTLSEQGAGGQTSTYYRVHVELSKDELDRAAQRGIVLRPGMTASIDIRTGRRSVLNYLAKPIFRAFGGALIER